MGGNSGLTQALAVSAAGIIILVIDVFTLGVVVDYFTMFATSLPIAAPIFQDCMGEIIIFGKWFYYIINIMGILFIIYPVIFVIKRHRYMDVEPVADQQIYQ